MIDLQHSLCGLRALLLVLMTTGLLHADVIGHWPLDDGLSDPETLTVRDVSGNGYDGELVDLFADEAWVSGDDAVHGGALNFEAQDGRVWIDIDDLPIGNAARTLAAWVNVPFVSNDQKFLSYGAQGNGQSFDFTIEFDGNEPHVWFRHWGGNIRYPGAVEDEYMHFAAVVPEGAEFTSDVLVYINGEETEGFRGAGEDRVLDTGFSPLAIGSRSDGPNFFDGFVDDVWLLDEALDADGIRAIMAGDLPNGSPGDFNGNGVLDLADINMLVWESASQENNAKFDLNEDQLVNQTDVTVWAKDLANTWIGDANLDGEFNSGDLVVIFTAGKSELDTDANWGEGDWTGDHRFNSSDLVAAFTDGGYELGPRPVIAVPEPTSIIGLTVGLMGMAICRRRQLRRRG